MINNYMEAIEKNEIINELINSFSILLLEEKNKKGRISESKVFNFYTDNLEKKDYFNNCYFESIGVTNNYILHTEKKLMANKNVFLNYVTFQLDKKNLKCNIKAASFENNLEGIKVNHKIAVRNGEMDLSIELSNENKGNAYSINLENNKVIEREIKNNHFNEKAFLEGKEELNKILKASEYNQELIFEYLFLGKKLNQEFLDMLLLDCDLSMDNSYNIFRINLNEKVVPMKNKIK